MLQHFRHRVCVCANAIEEQDGEKQKMSFASCCRVRRLIRRGLKVIEQAANTYVGLRSILQTMHGTDAHLMATKEEEKEGRKERTVLWRWSSDCQAGSRSEQIKATLRPK